MTKHSDLMTDLYRTSYFAMYCKNIFQKIGFCFKSIWEQDKSSNIAYCSMFFVYAVISTQVDLSLGYQLVLFLTAVVCTYFGTFSKKMSTFWMRLFVVFLPYMTINTSLAQSVKISEDHLEWVMVFLFAIATPLMGIHLFRTLKNKYLVDRDVYEDEINLSENIQQRKNAYIQFLQEELQRRTLAKEIIKFAEIGGIEVDPMISSVDFKTNEIHQKIKRILEEEKEEKIQQRIVEEKKELRDMYIEYKEKTLLSNQI
jgi:hypothetical protein